MDIIYLSAGFSIHPHQHLIQKGAEASQVRPKTFALLLLLLESPREILSKRFLLDTIWDDVTVDEPVLVQSIREIRQLFGDANVIQTYPRKGYAWMMDVKKQNNSDEISTEIPASPEPDSVQTPLHTSSTHTNPTHKNSARQTYKIIAAVIALCAVFFSAWFYKNTQQQNQISQTQVVIILPVKNAIEGNDHNWVYLGAMDQLISSLTSSNQVQVMNVDYVLDLMQFGKIPKAYTSEEANRVFSVSGATLVVESQLSGSVDEYELSYSLHFKTDIKHGVILDKNINEALHKLSLVIAGYTGQSLSSSVASQNAFINELMARALEKFNAQDFDAARTFLITLKQLEPNDLVVRELLVKTLVKLQDANAKEEAQAAFELAKTQHQPEPATLHTFLAMTDLNAGQVENALTQLDTADTLASKGANILYQAYNAQIRGFILQQKGDFALAQKSYETALKFHGLIRCPIGMAITHIDMAKLFAAQEKQEQANEQLAQAKQLITEHKLDSLTDMLNLQPVDHK